MSGYGNGDLERYLLGMLPDDARDQIDERLLVDTELFEALCVVENELAYDYALGLLPPDERHRFEERFLDRPAMQARVRTAAALIDGIRAAEPASSKFPWWRYAAAAASILLVAWLVRDEARLRRIGQPEAPQTSAPATPSASVSTPATQAPPSANAPGRPQSAEASGAIVALVLQPGVVRSSGSPSRIGLRLSDTLRMELALPAASPSFPSYRASIRNPDDVLVWEGAAMAANDGRGIGFSIPASSLPAGDYEVTLYGQQPAGRPEDVASYALSVTRR